MSGLFDPLTVRGLTLRNRIGVAPMCQGTSTDGHVNDWHLVHLGARALGGAALVMFEAAGVTPEGRISTRDAGLWDDAQIEGYARVNRFISAAGAASAIQLGHAGRKSSFGPIWAAQGMQGLRVATSAEGGWTAAGPSAIPFDTDTAQPRAMSDEEICAVPAQFARAAQRAEAAGFDWIEVHAAHGYLLHSFLSPISNLRTDGWGGSFDNRIRLCLETARAIRAVWPERKPLAFRLSYTDWVEGGWTLEESVELSRRLREEGVDLIDASSGGTTPAATNLARHMTTRALDGQARGRDDGALRAQIPLGPGYQVPGAEAIRRGADILVAAVGLITDPTQADAIVREGRADMVMLARELLRDPNWPIRAALALGEAARMSIPCQYYLAWSDRGGSRFDPVAPET